MGARRVERERPAVAAADAGRWGSFQSSSSGGRQAGSGSERRGRPTRRVACMRADGREAWAEDQKEEAGPHAREARAR